MDAICSGWYHRPCYGNGDYSPYLSPDDPIRPELESFFPPSPKAEDAAGKTAG